MVRVIVTTPHGHCNGKLPSRFGLRDIQIDQPICACTLHHVCLWQHIYVLSVEEHLTTSDYDVTTTFELE